MTIGAAVVALLLVGWRRTWRITRHVITIVHEAGHALVALLTGRRLAGIRLHSDTSGVTVSVGRPTGPGMVFTSLAGYIAPSLVGLGLAALVAAKRTELTLWLSIGLLVAMLVVIRNVFGVISIVLTGAVFFLVSWYADQSVQAAFCYLVAWFLLFGGIRPVGELQRKRRTGQAKDSDADQLARLTRTPGILWVGLFGVVSIAALLFGGGLLLGTA
nr:M50 family metallopeptidase [Goodfellowiella coeruleoviolacea]